MVLWIVPLPSEFLIIFLGVLFLAGNKGITLLSWGCAQGINSLLKLLLASWGMHWAFDFLNIHTYWGGYLIGTSCLTDFLGSFDAFLAASPANVDHKVFSALITVTKLFCWEIGLPANSETKEGFCWACVEGMLTYSKFTPCCQFS